MSGSVKITDVHAEFGLQMDKGSVNRFKRGFSGTVKQLKEGTKEIGFSAVSSLEGVAKQGGFFGNVVGGGIRGLVTGGLIKAVVAGAVAGMATIGVAAKQFSNEFEKTTDKFADILDTADALNMKIQDIERLKFFADLKGAKYEDFIKLIQKVNQIGGNIKTEGLNKDENKLINYVFAGNGSNLSGLQKIDLLTQHFTKVHKEQGVEAAVAEVTKIIPAITKNSPIFAALTSGNAEMVKAYFEAKVIPESRTKELRDKVQEGRETVAKMKNEQSYNEDIRYLDDYNGLKKSYLSINNLSETCKDVLHTASGSIGSISNFFNNALGAIKTFNEMEERSKQYMKELKLKRQQKEQDSKNVKVEIEHKNQQKINVFNNNTSTQSLKDR